jgi:hypothetical protein
MKTFKTAVKDIAEVVIFENWLRYYFVSEEEGDKLFLRVPEEVMQEIKEKHEHLYPVAEELNNGEIDYQRSQEVVCTFVAKQFDGQKYNTGTVPRAFDSKDLKVDLHLFGLWQEGHQERLDREHLSFEGFSDFFQTWKNTDEVQNYRKKLLEAEAHEHASCSASGCDCNTLQ